jgi:hypothetical protein
LTFPVDGRYTSDPANLQLSALQVLPSGAEMREPRYMADASQQTQRPSPQFINIRHRLLPDGRIDNLNLQPDMNGIIRRGCYQALHYFDAGGDGWIAASCPELEGVVEVWKPAYCMVGLPDFFPQITQRELMLWWRDKVPKAVRAALWAIEPLALSQTRIAANITLPAGFSIDDTTIAAIVSQPENQPGPVQTPNGPWTLGKTGLLDDLRENEGAERCHFARLQHHGAARRDGRRYFRDHLMQWVVPRGDAPDHAHRLTHDERVANLLLGLPLAKELGVRAGDHAGQSSRDSLRECGRHHEPDEAEWFHLRGCVREAG